MERFFWSMLGAVLLFSGLWLGLVQGVTRGAEIAELKEELAAVKRSAVLVEVAEARAAVHEARKAKLFAACIEEAVRVDRAEKLLPSALRLELEQGALGDYVDAKCQLDLFMGQFGQLTRDEEPRMTAKELVAEIERRAVVPSPAGGGGK